MIRRLKELASSPSPSMRGGQGTGQTQAFFSAADSSTALAAFNIMSLEPGVSIGEHRHEGTEEIYYVVEGRAQVRDDGAPAELGPGDALLTKDGHTHSLVNPGPGTLRFIAVLIKKP